jgi:hypothetical protein
MIKNQFKRDDEQSYNKNGKQYNMEQIYPFCSFKIQHIHKKSEALEPSYVELLREISDIKRVQSSAISNEKAQIEHYIAMVEYEIEKMKQSKEEQERLVEEIEEVSAFIGDIDVWVG